MGQAGAGIMQGGQTGVQYYAAFNEYQQSKQNARTNEKIANRNAKVAEMEAKSAEETARINAARASETARKEQSTRRALYGASGIALDSGSPLAMLAETATDSRQKQSDIMRSGVLKSSSLLSEAETYRTQARLARKSRMSKTALGLNLASITFGAASSAMSMSGGSSSSGGK